MNIRGFRSPEEEEAARLAFEQERKEKEPLEAFRSAKKRVEAARAWRDDIKSLKKGPLADCPRYQRRINELRELEAVSTTGREKEETMFDLRKGAEGQIGTPQIMRGTLEYTSPDGLESVTEELVFFFTLDKTGKPKFVTDMAKKSPMGINADLYDTRQKHHLRSEYIDYNVRVLPRLGSDGKPTGIITIFEDRK